jgi:hypothetical protein
LTRETFDKKLLGLGLALAASLILLFGQRMLRWCEPA